MNLKTSFIRRITAIAVAVASIVICFIGPNFSANAAGSDAVSSISVGKGSYDIGDTFTVTVTVSAKSIESIEGRIKYDPSNIEFVSSDDANGAEGILILSKWNTGKKALNSISSQISFKAKSAGKSTISFEPTEVCNSSLNQINASGSSINVSVKGGATLSGNADLKSISVSGGTLTPAFSADITEYTVTVSNTVTKAVISAEPVDGNAKVALSGSSELKVGTTRRAITVTAPNGARKSYVVNFNRLDKDGESVSKIYDDTGIGSANRNDTNDSSQSLNGSTSSAVMSAPRADSPSKSADTDNSISRSSGSSKSNSALITVLAVACAVLLIALIIVTVILKNKSASVGEKARNQCDNQTDNNEDKESESDED